MPEAGRALPDEDAAGAAAALALAVVRDLVREAILSARSGERNRFLLEALATGAGGARASNAGGGMAAPAGSWAATGSQTRDSTSLGGMPGGNCFLAAG